MSIALDFEELRRDLDSLFDSKEKIERQIQEKARKLYKLNSECISNKNSEQNINDDIKLLSFEICKYVNEVLQVKLKKELREDGAEFNQARLYQKVDNGNANEQKESTSENSSDNTNRNPLINTSSYAFQNVYKLDDFMNTTNWLWNRELKSRIIEVASNRNKNPVSHLSRPQKVVGSVPNSIQIYKKKQCNTLPKLVCRTLTIDKKEENTSNQQNPLKSYIQKAFKS